MPSAAEVWVANSIRPAEADWSGPEGVSGESAGLSIMTAQPPKAARTTMGRTAHLDGVRQAAQALLDAWDSRGDTLDNGAQGLTDAIAALRSTLAASAATPRPIDNSQGRPGTKQAQVLAMLVSKKVPAGPRSPKRWAGWAPHTVRGFLAGLAKKGIAVEVLERVRQVGPKNKALRGAIPCVASADGAALRNCDQLLRLNKSYADAPVCPRDSPLREGVV